MLVASSTSFQISNVATVMSMVWYALTPPVWFLGDKPATAGVGSRTGSTGKAGKMPEPTRSAQLPQTSKSVKGSPISASKPVQLTRKPVTKPIVEAAAKTVEVTTSVGLGGASSAAKVERAPVVSSPMGRDDTVAPVGKGGVMDPIVPSVSGPWAEKRREVSPDVTQFCKYWLHIREKPYVGYTRNLFVRQVLLRSETAGLCC